MAQGLMFEYLEIDQASSFGGGHLCWIHCCGNGGVEQTRGQRQTGRNDLPGKGERVASGW